MERWDISSFNDKVLHRTVAFNHSRRLASTYTDKPFFLTCPIFYVNSKPHLGHAYTTCLADSWARYAHLRNQAVLKPFQQDYTASSYSSVFDYCSSNKTFLSCGTDEHGSKVRRAATANKFDPLQYCNHMSPLFKISDQMLSDLFIYLDSLPRYSHEAFYMPWEVSETSVSGVPIAKETGNPVEWIEEENYMFKLSSFKNDLHRWLDSGIFSKSSSQSVWGDIAHNIVDTTQDVSISRPKCRLDWGIQVPVDDKQIIYVWLDALVSYLTVAGFPWSTDDSSKQILWPPDIQFHAVLWPALLMAVDLPLPRRLICHHHVLVDDVKMSKSRGNHIDPISEQCALFAEELNNITPGESDVLRYVLLRLPLLTSDSTYSREMARQMINTELVNWIGNLLSRITSESLNPEQSIIQINRNEVNDMFHHDNLDTDFFNRRVIIFVFNYLDNISYHFDKLWWYKAQPHNAIEEVLRVVRQTNAFITRHSPWSEQEPLRRQAVISVVAESLRVCALLMYPVVPNLSHRLLNRLGIHNKESQLSSQLDGARVLGENTGKFLRKL
ncbi:Methionine--tRNA ligase, mitochondrial [Schistosoma japonicum]|nr:Methionine--tRNA ligase, mitochondrial [Schistosoma japonicum]